MGNNETNSAIYLHWCSCFFLRFNERLASLYPELFEDSGDGFNQPQGFAGKWGYYEEIVVLADDKVQRVIGVEQGTPVGEYPLHACYLYLAYIKEKTIEEAKRIKNNFK